MLLELFKDTITKVAMSGWLPTIPNVGGHYYNRADFESAKILDLDSITSDEIDLRTRAFWYPPDDGAYVERAGHRYTLVSHEILCSLAEEGYRTSLDHSFHRHFKDARNAQSDGADGVKS